ncbi:hypothetical protein V2A60_004908 [Cordyceps javanica]
MDNVTTSLQSLLRQRFHITPTNTARRDQWFKRVYQVWAEDNKELLLLTPKASREEWAPEMLQLSAQLASHIRHLAGVERQILDASFPPRQDKLFPDSVFDEPPLMCQLDDRQAPALSPSVQRGDWWPNKDLVDLAYVGQALLEHGQIAALVHVAEMRDVDLKDAADLRNHSRSRWGLSTEEGAGWGKVVDEVLLIFFFVAIIGTFPEELGMISERYTEWLPYGELLCAPSPPKRFIDALKKRPGFKGLRSGNESQPHMQRCVRILAAADILYESCHLAAIDWEPRISSAMLYFVGFEAWNRGREGHTYLYCPFNSTKNGKWLAHGVEMTENQYTIRVEENSSSAKNVKPARPRDPLRLRERRVGEAGSDSDDEEQAKLAALERAEAANLLSAPAGEVSAAFQPHVFKFDSTFDPDGPTFSEIMYPFHEDHEDYDKGLPPTLIGSLTSSDLSTEIRVEAVCRRLRIPESTYYTLMTSYFENMTSFSLFKPHSIEGKFTQMNSIVEAEALVASIFTFSARFHASDKDKSTWNYFPAPSYFAKIASRRIEDAFESYDDTPPPLWLLQASVLETFYRLTRSVRSRSWRAMGNLVRLGYDLKLHLVDVDGQKRDGEGKINVESWSAQEERRRCWWAIWELDVFASTIRRLPLGVDWSQIYTFLPVHDSYWFGNVYQPSCHLPQDAAKRWKALLECGNTSPRAWFVAISSLMHDAQQVVYNPEAARRATGKRQEEHLALIADSLRCTAGSLPGGLAYSGQTLDFRTKAAPNEASIRQYHADVFGIHIMTQLTRFMIYHHRVCAQAPWAAAPKAGSSSSNRGPGAGVGGTAPGIHGSPSSRGGEGEWVTRAAAADPSAWTDYMKAAEAIVTLVRSSARDSYKYLNPFGANALWFAAAAQIACLVFGPAQYSKRRAASSYELLALSIDQCIDFWDSAEILKPRLGRVEAALRNMVHAAEQRGRADGDSGSGSGGGSVSVSGGRGTSAEVGGGDAEMKPPPSMTSANSVPGAVGYTGMMGAQPPDGGGELDGRVMGHGTGMGGGGGSSSSMGTVGPQQTNTLSFLPMFQELPLVSQLDDDTFENLGYLFPYRVDDARAGNTYRPPTV